MFETDTTSIENLRAKIKSIRFGMLTTLNDDKSLSSRPMTQQQLDDEGNLWFFISDDSDVARDINKYSDINVSFAEPADNLYISTFGHAEVLKSHEKAQELWSPAVAVWFPGGLEDPHLALIKFTIRGAEYWDSSSNKMLKIFALPKAAIVGKPPADIGEHGKIDLNK